MCQGTLFILPLSARHGQLKCVRLLLERGARVVPDNEGVSPLELCAQVAATVASSARMVLPLLTLLLPSPPFSLLSLQSGYHECVEAMLTPYPGEVDLLVRLVSTEKIPEAKALSLMEYLCNASTYLLAVVLRKLARNASTAGMELLR